jgi:hypothetical protein
MPLLAPLAVIRTGAPNEPLMLARQNTEVVSALNVFWTVVAEIEAIFVFPF